MCVLKTTTVHNLLGKVSVIKGTLNSTENRMEKCKRVVGVLLKNKVRN